MIPPRRVTTVLLVCLRKEKFSNPCDVVDTAFVFVLFFPPVRNQVLEIQTLMVREVGCRFERWDVWFERWDVGECQIENL